MGELPKHMAQKFIDKYFPTCKLALLGGSAYRQELTIASDLDLIIIDERDRSSYRECFYYFGWKIENFVFNSRQSLDFAFEYGRMEGFPTIPRMCAESTIIKDDGTAKQLQQKAAEYLKSGPNKWTEAEQDHARFMITELVDDLNSSNNKMEQLFIATKLFEEVNQFILRANNQWIGYGKWMYRSIYNYDHLWCKQWIEIFEAYIRTRSTEPVNRYIEQLLKPNEGKLFKGYKQELL